jgi:transposase
MAILLDRDGTDVELKTYMNTIKKDFNVDTESKGDAKALRELTEWYVKSYKTKVADYEKEIQRLRKVEREYDEFTELMKRIKRFFK